MEVHKSSLKYTPFNFSLSVPENCEQIYINEVKWTCADFKVKCQL